MPSTSSSSDTTNTRPILKHTRHAEKRWQLGCGPRAVSFISIHTRWPAQAAACRRSQRSPEDVGRTPKLKNIPTTLTQTDAVKQFYRCYQPDCAGVYLPFIKTECKPEWDVVCIKHLCNTKQLSGVLLDRVQDDHLQYTHRHVLVLSILRLGRGGVEDWRTDQPDCGSSSGSAWWPRGRWAWAAPARWTAMSCTCGLSLSC